jgi:hypothetical protein
MQPRYRQAKATRQSAIRRGRRHVPVAGRLSIHRSAAKKRCGSSDYPNHGYGYDGVHGSISDVTRESHSHNPSVSIDLPRSSPQLQSISLRQRPSAKVEPRRVAIYPTRRFHVRATVRRRHSENKFEASLTLNSPHNTVGSFLKEFLKEFVKRVRFPSGSLRKGSALRSRLFLSIVADLSFVPIWSA